MNYHFSRRMSISHRDFLRILPNAVGNHNYDIQGSNVSVRVGQGELTIRLGEEAEHRIASLSLPSMELVFEFRGLDEEEIKNFLAHFDRSYQRGGG